MQKNILLSLGAAALVLGLALPAVAQLDMAEIRETLAKDPQIQKDPQLRQIAQSLLKAAERGSYDLAADIEVNRNLRKARRQGLPEGMVQELQSAHNRLSDLMAVGQYDDASRSLGEMNDVVANLRGDPIPVVSEMPQVWTQGDPLELQTMMREEAFRLGVQAMTKYGLSPEEVAHQIARGKAYQEI